MSYIHPLSNEHHSGEIYNYIWNDSISKNNSKPGEKYLKEFERLEPELKVYEKSWKEIEKENRKDYHMPGYQVDPDLFEQSRLVFLDFLSSESKEKLKNKIQI